MTEREGQPKLFERTNSMKIQLTIKTSYLPKWGTYEGIRELVQNARDAEVEHHAPMTIDWRNNVLRIENTGTTLPLKALLLGHTTKLGRSDTIGQFGEGLKLGILALVRDGIAVKIRNGGEVWIPCIERSAQFDEDVLAFDVQKGRLHKERVRVEIACSKDAWESIRDRFLFVSKPKQGEVVETNYGSILTADKYRGHVFVKGIYVQTDKALQFGYDLRDASLDRDRKMVEYWNLKSMTKNILVEAINKAPTLMRSFFGVLGTVTPETEWIEGSDVSEEAAKVVSDAFLAEHGQDAIPVETMAESADIEHLGKRGIVVPKPLRAVLSATIGDMDRVKEDLRKEVAKTYSWHEMTESEKDNLTSAIALVNEVEAVSLEDVIVVDFRSDNMMGQYKDGRVYLAHKYLCDRSETLSTIVHEVAHKCGSDGDKGHVAQIERIWAGIVNNLRGVEA